MNTLTTLLRRKFDLDRVTDRFERDMREFVFDEGRTPLLSDDKFWDWTEILVKQLHKSLKYRKGFDDGLKHAIDECMRAQLVEKRGQATFAGLCRYVATYEDVTKRISRGLDKFHGVDRGDDSFGDLADLLPLAGREICDAVMTRINSKGKKIPSDFSCIEASLHDHPWSREILHGEHYVRMTLMETLVEKMGIPARDEYHPDREELHLQ